MSTQSARSDESSSAEAVRRWRDGNLDAGEELARDAMRLALRTAAALLENREEAADVAQEVAIDVLDSLGKLRDPEAFNAWVHRITVRRTLRRLKLRRRTVATETPLALLNDSKQPPPPEGLDRDTVLAARSALAAAFAELPPKQRLALTLRYVHDLSDAEIAAALSCRTGTVHALLSRGRGALRQDKQLAELALAFEGG